MLVAVFVFLLINIWETFLTINGIFWFWSLADMCMSVSQLFKSQAHTITRSLWKCQYFSPFSTSPENRKPPVCKLKLLISDRYRVHCYWPQQDTTIHIKLNVAPQNDALPLFLFSVIVMTWLHFLPRPTWVHIITLFRIWCPKWHSRKWRECFRFLWHANLCVL